MKEKDGGLFEKGGGKFLKDGGLLKNVEAFEVKRLIVLPEMSKRFGITPPYVRIFPPMKFREELHTGTSSQAADSQRE